MDFVSDRLLLWIVLLPLLGAVINGLFGRFANRQLVGALGVGSVAISFVLALVCFLRLAGFLSFGEDLDVPHGFPSHCEEQRKLIVRGGLGGGTNGRQPTPLR